LNCEPDNLGSYIKISKIFQPMTLKMGIEKVLKEEVPEVKEVVGI